MRELLFRGQTRRFGERIKNFAGDPMPSHWVYGGVFHQNDRGGAFSVIYSYDPVEKHVVYADTVGQYTGINDKNDTQIFEGDIVEIVRTEEKGVIKWNEDTARFIISSDSISADFDNYWGKDLEVIGNIYDNRDLYDDITRGSL